VPLAPVGNVLTEMCFSKSAIAVNCARPGNTLGRMADYGREKWFERALLQRNGWDWHALLLSCGGNDLIDVCQVLAHAPDGSRIPLAQRIRHETGLATIGVGLITEPEQAEAIVAEGRADMVALARGILYDPRWPWHAAAKLGAQVDAPKQYWRSQPREVADLFRGAKIGQR